MIRIQTIRALSWTSIASLCGNLLQFLQLIIVANFISAQEYGLMTIVLVVIYFVQFFVDMGIPNAMIFRQQLSNKEFNSLFWFNSFVAWIFMGAIFFTAPFLSSFYDQPNMTLVLRITASMFFFVSLDSHYRGILKMKLKFKELAIAEISGKTVSFVSAILLATTGWGIYSLVYATLAASLVTALLNVMQGWRYYKISRHFNFSDVRPFLPFGLYQTGENIVNYLNYQVDSILIGKLIGIEALGIYALAKNLAIKPLQIINPIGTQVGFPVMAKVKEDKSMVRRIYLEMIRYLGAINFLVYPFIIAFAGSILSIFFNQRWLGATPVLQILAIYFMIRSVYNPIGALMASQGLVHYSFRYNFVLLLVIPAFIFFFSGWGLIWIALGFVFIMILLYVPIWKFLVFPACQATFYEYWEQVKRPLLMAALLTGVLLIYHTVPIYPESVKLIGGFILWIILSALFTRYLNPKLFADAYSLIKELEKIFSKKRQVL